MKNLLKSQRLIDLVKDEAIEFGDFELSSGLRSNYFIDMSKITNCSYSLNIIIQNLLYYLDGDIDWRCDSVGGPVLGAAPLIGGLLFAYDRHFASIGKLRGFLVRKEEKNGTFIEGNLKPGDNVLIVEDVVTTGTQTKRAIDIVEANGAHVRGVVAILDRMGGARELLGERFQAMMTVEDLGLK